MNFIQIQRVKPHPADGCPRCAREAANPWLIHPGIEVVRAWNGRTGDLATVPGFLFTGSYN
jgi:hypothetical protein